MTQLLPHHRYVCTRHRYWIGPPDIDQPATALRGLDDIVACAATPPAAAAPLRPCRHLRRGADRVPVLRPPLGGVGGDDGVGVHREWTRRADVLIPPGTETATFSASRLFAAVYPEAVSLAALIASPNGDTWPPVMPISSDSSPQKSGVASTARTTRATAVTLSPTG